MGKYKYNYTGELRIHITGVAGFVEPGQEVESETKINHPHFEPLFDEPVENSSEVVENKKRKHKT